jgi:Type IV secretory system Conjugative DNA transfer
VRSNSDSTSESESTSRSLSRSESQGRSSSTGTSENEGTNSSVSSGTSGGSNWSRTKGKTKNYGQSWTPVKIFFGAGVMKGNLQRNNSRSFSDSLSTGGSKGWNQGRSDGESHGTSRSQTEGTSDTTGTSESRSEGTSETIQKRALVTPDEIGQLFARIDDRASGAYPGLALVVIAGAPPVALRRVNYYEDFQFMGLFDPNPDYPQSTGPKELTVGADGMLRWRWYFENKLLKLGPWEIAQGRTVEGGFAAAPLLTSADVAAGNLRAPRAGMISAVTSPAALGSPLFSLRYYEDGAALIDPFAEIAAYHDNYIKSRVEERAAMLKITERLTKISFGFIFLTAMGAVLGAWAVVTGLLGLAVLGTIIFKKMKQIADTDKGLKFLRSI